MRYRLLILSILVATLQPLRAAIVWEGHVVFPVEWTTAESLPASCFAKAQAGHVVRLHHQGLHGGAQVILRTSGWGVMPGMEGAGLLSGRHSDILISKEMLDELQQNGCIVFGIGFTLTAVEILSKKERPRLEVGVPVVNDWMWTSPEVPTFHVNVTNPTDDPVDFDIEITISDDKISAPEDFAYPCSLAAGESQSYDFKPARSLRPGFYLATIHVAGEEARTFYFGVDADKLASPPDKQSDFLDFWQEAKDELAAIDPQYTLTELPDKSSAQRKVYLLEMKSVADATGEGIVRAYYAEPTAPGRYPAVLHFCAYDGGGGLSIPRADDHPSQIDIIVSTRGQSINNRPPYTNLYGEWLVYGFGRPETWYYRGAYMDCLRALDFLLSREKVQPENIFATGSSQGGAFTIACAALSDGRLNAIAPACSFLGDFPDYFQLVCWPYNAFLSMQRGLGLSDEAMYAMLSYFDTKNLATLITCPVLMNFSLQDTTCPPHTVWAAYNNLASTEKQYIPNPTLGHTTGETWGLDVADFFASHVKDPDAIQSVTVPQSDDASYDLRGVRHSGTLSTLPPGIYIHRGRKVVK